MLTRVAWIGSVCIACPSAHAADSVELYGVIDNALQYVRDATPSAQSLAGMVGGNLSGSDWGMKGTEELGPFRVMLQLGSGFDPGKGLLDTFNGNALVFGPQAYVGVQHDGLGTLRFGRQYDPVVDLLQTLTADQLLGSSFATAGDVDNYDDSSRTSRAVKFISPSLAGVTAEAMYAPGGVAGHAASEQTWSVAASYSGSQLSFGVGWFVAVNRSVNGTPRSDWESTSDGTFDGSLINQGFQTARSISIVRVVGRYVNGPVTLGIGYGDARYRPDLESAFRLTERFETGQGFAAYQVSVAWLLVTGYSYTHAIGEVRAAYSQISLGGDYRLSRATDLYLVGAWQHASGKTLAADGTSVVSAQASIGSYGYSGGAVQTIASIGIRHRF